MILEFEIAGLPKMTNTSRVHWTKKMKEASKWKRLVRMEVIKRQAIIILMSTFHGPLSLAPLSKAKLTLTRHSSVEPDFDGLVSSFKHVVDGLVEARVIENDKVSNIGQPTYLWQKCAPRQGKISVKVESVT